MPCPKCVGFSERLNIETPREYQDLARQLIQIVSEGTLLLVGATCPLEDVLKTPFPGDTLSHTFQCFACGRKFHLDADTYHGHASWTVEEETKLTTNLKKPN